MASEPRDPQPTLDTVRAWLDLQLSFSDAIDSKAGTFLSAGSALLALVAAVMALRGGHELDPAAVAALIVCGLVYAVIAVAAYQALAPRKWAVGPDLDELASHYRDARFTNPDLANYIITTTYQAYADNKPHLEAKQQSYRICFWALVVETVAASAALIALVARP